MTVDLSEGWILAALREVADINMGQSPPGSTYNDTGKGLPFFQGKMDFGPRYPSVRVWCTEPKKLAQPGDVLISVRAPVGPTNVAEQTCVIGRGLAALAPLGGIPTEFLLFALRLLEPELAVKGTGSTFTAINHKNLEEIEIDIPPLAEQKRIIAKVEEFLARVNAVRERLEKVPKIMKRFRQTVLAAACSGKLTEDWRQMNRDIRPASELLERVAIEKQNGMKAAVDDADGMNELPERWEWATMGQITVNHDARRIPVKSDDRAQRRGQYSYYGASGIIDTIDDYLFDGSFLLIAEDGANLEMRSTPIAFQAHGRFWVNNHAHVVQTKEGIQQAYLELCLNGADIQKFITGSAQPKLTQTHMNRIPVPLPPSAEQREIVRRVDALFKLADAIEKHVALAKSRADKLTQSILAKAFRGELVPREAELASREGRDYEPASVLLERIRAERKKQDRGGRHARLFEQ